MLIVNLSQDKSRINPYISSSLLSEIEDNLKNKKKIILYLNKRWEYSSLVCVDCQKLYKCEHCDVSYSVHKSPERLICHLCWKIEELKKSCEQCWSKNLEKIWIWTQQIESSLRNYLWDKINIFRLDTDSVKSKTEKRNTLDKIHKSEIIIWTKMITTGFDFENIWLIWVILIEQEISIAKYDTEEKVYQNIKQLLWRWNRKWEVTNIIIQSFIPNSDIVKNIALNNYKDFFKNTLSERKMFSYPPFCEFIELEYRNQDKKKASEKINIIYNKLLKHINEDIEIIKVDTPFKKYSKYHYKIILKWIDLRQILNEIKNDIFKDKNLSVIFW